MTTVRWNRRSPLAGGDTLVTQEFSAELLRAFREAWRPKGAKGVASYPLSSDDARQAIVVHEIRLARRKR